MSGRTLRSDALREAFASVSIALVLLLGAPLSVFAQEKRMPPFYEDKMNLLVVQDDNGRMRAVTTTADWQERREHIVAGMQLVMGPLPGADRRVPVDIQVIETETLHKVTRKKITYASEKGHRVPAYLLIPNELTGKAPAMLCLHGSSGPRGRIVGVFDQRLKVIVTSSGFDSFSDYMGGDLKGWCQQCYMPRIASAYGKDPKQLPFDFPEVLAALAPRALYIHAPRGDSNFKVDSVRRCVAAAKSVYAVYGAQDRIVAAYPEGVHGFPPDARAAAYEFIDRVLRPD